MVESDASSQPTREPGFYWVLEHELPIVAEWDSAEWWVPGDDLPWKDEDFVRIISSKPLEPDQTG